jgi:hypothetical protein
MGWGIWGYYEGRAEGILIYTNMYIYCRLNENAFLVGIHSHVYAHVYIYMLMYKCICIYRYLDMKKCFVVWTTMVMANYLCKNSKCL